MLGRLAAGVAHDLANYLGVVDLSLAALKRRLENGGGREDIAAAREATEHAMRLTSCLLAYARGCAPPPSPVDMSALVMRLLAVFGRIIPDGVKVEVDGDSEPPHIDGVRPELEQLVLNLVLNACESMPDGGTLRLSVYSTDSTVCLEISDTGIGLSEAIVAAGGPLTPSSKPERAGGEGLGLGIVREVAARHHARLVVTPRTGGGTSVQVVFPLPAVARRA